MGEKAQNPEFQTKMITPATREAFKELIVANVYAEMEEGIPVTAIGLTDDDVPVGAVAGMLRNERVFEVRSLYVDPDHRRMGGATMLLESLKRLLDLRDALAVISYVEVEKGSITAFMESRECILENGLERIYRGTVDSFFGSGLFNRGFKSKEIRSFSQLNNEALEKIKNRIPKLINESGISMMSDCKIDADMSFAAANKDGLVGILLTGHHKDFPDEPIVIISESAVSKVVGGLLNAFFNACSETMGEDTYVRFPVATDRFDQMMDRIEGVKNIQHNYIF